MQLLPVKTDLASSEVTMIQIVQRNGVHVGLDLGLGMRNKSKLIPGTGAGMGHKSQVSKSYYTVSANRITASYIRWEVHKRVIHTSLILSIYYLAELYV